MLGVLNNAKICKNDRFDILGFNLSFDIKSIQSSTKVLFSDIFQNPSETGLMRSFQYSNMAMTNPLQMEVLYTAKIIHQFSV